MGTARDDLLARVIDEVAAGGLQDRSLRELATASGTSHRMLLYHFGSREGLVDAVVAAVESSERDLLRTLAEQAEGASDLVRALWQHVASPEMRPFIRLFFESLAYASQARGGDQLTRPWLDDSEEVAALVGVDFDPVEIRLGVAVVRGLLIDVLASDSAVDATAALERFLAMWEATRSPVGSSRRQSV